MLNSVTTDRPFGLSVDPNTKNLVVSSQNRILILDKHANEISQFGESGYGNECFSSPFGVFVDSDSTIIVCDYNNTRIQIIDKHGKFHSPIKMKSKPIWVAVDLKGSIFVATGKNMLLKYVPE